MEAQPWFGSTSSSPKTGSTIELGREVRLFEDFHSSVNPGDDFAQCSALHPVISSTITVDHLDLADCLIAHFQLVENQIVELFSCEGAYL